MDWTLIVVAALALVGSLTGSIAGVKQSNKVTNLRLDQLEEKMDKHNNLVQKINETELYCKQHSRAIEEIKHNCKEEMKQILEVLAKGEQK